VQKELGETVFRTYVGKTHTLYEKAKKKTVVPIKTLLQHGFVCSSRPILGAMKPEQSVDGWRDDHFQRRIDYVVPSLLLIEEIVESGAALTYLPEHLVARLNVLPLSISGCPYSCKQTVKIMARNADENRWLLSLLEGL
jgi:DNA-binding transcriptional LysR family regulator